MAVTSADGKLELVSFKMTPNKLKYGDEATFEITLKNLVGSSINDFSAYMRLDYPIISEYYSSWSTESTSVYGNLKYTDPYNFTIDLTSISWAKNATKTFSGKFKFLPHSGIDLYVPDPSKRFQVYNGSTYKGLSIIFKGNYNSNTNYAFNSYFNNLETAGNIQFLDSFYEPTIKEFDVERSIGNVLNDEGTNLLTSISLGLNAGSRPELMTLKLLYRNSNKPEEGWYSTDLTSKVNDALASKIQVVMTSYTFATNADYDLILQFGDQYESVEMPLYVSRAFANVHLSGKPLGGVCFGSFSKSTDTNPLFECQYPAKFFNGIEGVTNYSEDEVFTGGTWIDGKPIYRYVLTATKSGGGSTAIGTLPSTPNVITSITGTMKQSDGSWRPISFIYYGSLNWGGSVYVAKDNTIYIQLGSSYSGSNQIVLIFEYTKA